MVTASTVSRGIDERSGLYFQVAGHGEAAVIALHGLFGDSDNLAALAQVLSSHFRVYRLDLRNHGRSTRAERMDFAALAGDVSTFMDSKGIAASALVGHSLGGKVAMQLALQNPQRVTQLVVADIAPVQYPPHHQRILDALESIDIASATNRQWIEQRLQPYVDDLQVRQFLLKNVVRDAQGGWQWRFNVAAIVDGYDDMLRGVFGTAYQGPTLFIKGEHSNYITAAHRDAISQLFPHAQLKMISGAGHWLHVEKPAAFNRVVMNFLLA